MDKKLDKLLGGCLGYWLSLRDSEKQIWFDAQEAMLEVGYRKLEPQQPEGRIAKMLQSGDRVRLWYGRRFLDRDCISNEWIIMDSQGNRGLGDCLYSGTNLAEALDVLEAKP